MSHFSRSIAIRSAVGSTVAAGLTLAIIGCGVTSPATSPPTVSAVPRTNSTRVLIGARPFGAAISNAGTVLVTQQDANALTRVQLETPNATASIAVGVDPGDVVFDGSGNTAYVTNFIAGTLGKVDLPTGRQTTTLELGGSAFRVLLSADGRKLFVASGNGMLRVVDPSSLSVQATIDIPPNPNGITQIGDRVYVTSSSAGVITEINVATKTVARTLRVGGRLQDIAASSDGSELYVADEAGTVDIVTVANGSVATRLAVEGGAFGLALALDGYLYVALSNASKVVVIDPKSRTTRATIVTGGIPRRVAIDPKGRVIVVPNEAGWADVLR